MKELNKELKAIAEGIDDKKGHGTKVIDLRKCGDTICCYLVICEGNTPTQVHAIAESVGDKMREMCDERPLAVEGMRNCLWVAMDYADIMVHIFVPDCRQFYDLDHLWEDGEIVMEEKSENQR